MENSHPPDLVSPPETKTPPTAINKHNQINGQRTNGADRAGSEPIDPAALSKALKDMEDAGKVRERTPGASPSRKRQRVYGDRSVPTSSPFTFSIGSGRLVHSGGVVRMTGWDGVKQRLSIGMGG